MAGTRVLDLTTLILQIQDDGTAVPRHPTLNFIGAGVSVAEDSGNDRIDVTIPGGGGGGGYDTIEEEGVAVAQETVMNFVGPLITATPGTGKTTITAPKIIWNQTIIADGSDGDLPIFDDDGDAFLLNIGTLGQVLTVAGTGQAAWEDAGGGGGIDRENVANPLTDFWLYDEFFYPTPQSHLPIHYEIEGTFTAVNQVIGGQVTFRTNNSANAICRINTCGGGLVAIDSTKNWRLVVRLRQQTVTVNTALLISFYTDGGQKPSGVFPFASPQPQNIELRADGTGNYFAKTNNNVTPNSQDTGVAADTAFHVFEIRSDPGGPNIEFLIDGNIVATFTTNLPTGIKAMFIGCQTQTTAFARLDVDSMFLYQER